MGYHRPGEWEKIKKLDLRANIHYELKGRLALGESKHKAKKDGTRSEKIFSTNTYKAYEKACDYFADYVIAHSPDKRNTSLEDARQFAADFLKEEINNNFSAWTVQQHRSALAKLFGCESCDILPEVPAQNREDRTRSHGERYIESEKTGKMILNQSIKQGHFSEKNNAEIVLFARSTGLRRGELTAVRGEQLYEKDGSYYIKMDGKQCKGGRPRDVLIIGEHAREIYEIYAQKGENKCFDRIPNKMDCHYYRGEYARALYDEIARPTDTLDRAERYDCRGDKLGESYDRHALEVVSNNLGHNRLCVVLNYL